MIFDAEYHRKKVRELAQEPPDEPTHCELRPLTRDRGLSLGDRACLALANSLGVSALTTDGNWDGLDGAEVVQR